MAASEQQDTPHPTGIAIVGMTGRFPGARDLETYWRHIRDGAESVTYFSDEQLQAAGVPPEVLKQPAYVKARGILDDVEGFDAAFFGYSPKDALLMDPQQRLFLQCSWEVLEIAGYDPRAYRGLIGVYGGCTASSYMPQLYEALPPSQIDGMAIAMGNELPFLTSRVSYKLDLKGPSYPVQTACSTSLVAVHLACQGLLNAECDLAIAGGVSVRLPQTGGYWYQDEGILSPDGRCRPFDAKSQGTLFSNGIGMVALKRLEDALADRDTIYAVVRGSAINNDGSRRASFTAPGVIGQTNVVADALASSESDPESISYIETHGTATALGDSIEIQALTKAFGNGSARKQYCALGSVKANVGHLDAAAGIAGMIKTVLALRHRQLPPMVHFEKSNPDIKFENTPFYVNRTLKDWPESDGSPRRAGISSFGFGGSNAHVILEEAPHVEPSGPSRSYQLVPLSAESEAGLESATFNLADFFGRHGDLNLADAAYTLKVGRRTFRHRRALVCRSVEDGARLLDQRDPKFVFSGRHDGAERTVAFLFPGQGAQYVNMGADLYRDEAVFRDVVNDCAAKLKPHLGFDLREVLYPAGGVSDDLSRRLMQTGVAQPALFVVEYATARLWMSWGIQPDACLGHSIGEYVAACLSGVLTVEDALRLVALRGRLMQEMPTGVMLAVPLPEARVRRLLNDHLWLAAVNASSLCVLSGTAASIEAVEKRLQDEGIQCQRLQTSHAFHSGLMEAAVAPLVKAFAETKLAAPQIPYISNVTGTWIEESQARDPQYWGRQLREAVLFAAGAAELLKKESRLFLEVGPGHTLSTLVRRQAGTRGARDVVSSLRPPQEQGSDMVSVLSALSRLWVGGAAVDWSAFYQDEDRCRVALPTYPFELQRFWVAPSAASRTAALAERRRRAAGKNSNVDDWLYAPGWTQVSAAPRMDAVGPEPTNTWVVFPDQQGASAEISKRLESAGYRVVLVEAAERFARLGPNRLALNPASREEHEALIKDVCDQGTLAGVIHAWGVGGDDAGRSIDDDAVAQLAFVSLLSLAQALGQADTVSSVRLNVLTTGVHDVTGVEALSPSKAILLGLCHVIGQEYPHISCKAIDLGTENLGRDGSSARTALDQLLHDLTSDSSAPLVAYRGDRRWIQAFHHVKLAGANVPMRLRANGVYLITGGLGDIGLTIADYLARTVSARLVLTGRSVLPPEAEWDRHLATHDPSETTAQRIARVRGVRANGGVVLIVQADVADPQQMAEAFRIAEEQFGRIDGIIHGAGLIAGDAFRPISETDIEICRRQFLPKVNGLRVLDALLATRRPDFCMLVSSLSVLLGGLRYAAYASANAYLDAVAYKRNRTSLFPWITVNWDAWLRFDDEVRLKDKGEAAAGYVMTSAEGIGALHRILSADAGTQVVVSTGDLQTRLDQWLSMAAGEGAATPEEAAVRLPRPNLQTEFAAPSDELERSIAAIWQELLCVDRVGVNDNFFELGGDSLLGIQVIARLKKELGVKVSAVTLYEGPRVGLLADIIRASGTEPAAAAADGSRSRGERRRERKLQHETATEMQGA